VLTDKSAQSAAGAQVPESGSSLSNLAAAMPLFAFSLHVLSAGSETPRRVAFGRSLVQRAVQASAARGAWCESCPYS
jgi:hypothetical protein